MATIFPSNPSVDDEYNGYRYDGTAWEIMGIRMQPGPKGDQGPQGLKGDKGDTGEQGPKGDTGNSFDLRGRLATEAELFAVSSPVENEAYVVTENGGNLWVYDMTTEAWVNAGPIVGPKGDTGNTGATGATGAKGDKGDTGSTGATGAKGDTGDQGPSGVISVTSPITNTGTSTSAALGFDATGFVKTSDTGTVTSTMIANGTILDADINASAAIAKTKISGTAITAADTGTVTSTMIADGTIVNADINLSAAISANKVQGTVPSGGTASQILSKVNSTDYNTQWSTANLDFLSDVAISSVADKQLIVYDGATSTWKNADAIISSGIAFKSGVPASKTSTGITGQLCIDGTNGILYVCTSTNVWQKVSLNAANFTNSGGFV